MGRWSKEAISTLLVCNEELICTVLKQLSATLCKMHWVHVAALRCLYVFEHWVPLMLTEYPMPD